MNNNREFLLAVEELVVKALMSHGDDELKEYVLNFINTNRPYFLLKSEALQSVCEEIRGKDQVVIDWLLEMNWEIIKLYGGIEGLSVITEIYANAASTSEDFHKGFMDAQITDRAPTIAEAQKNLKENPWAIPLLAAFAIDIQKLAHEKPDVSD